MHYHIFWRAADGELRLLCVRSQNAASAIRAADDYLGESLVSISSVAEISSQSWQDCTVQDIKRHREEVEAVASV